MNSRVELPEAACAAEFVPHVIIERRGGHCLSHKMLCLGSVGGIGRGWLAWWAVGEMGDLVFRER